MTALSYSRLCKPIRAALKCFDFELKRDMKVTAPRRPSLKEASFQA